MALIPREENRKMQCCVAQLNLAESSDSHYIANGITMRVYCNETVPALTITKQCTEYNALTKFVTTEISTK